MTDWIELYRTAAGARKRQEIEWEDSNTKLKQLLLEVEKLDSYLKVLKMVIDKPLSHGEYIKIDWKVFMPYAIKTVKMWAYVGEYRTDRYRWWCKYSSCSTGGHGKINPWDTFRGYSLKTKTHNWRICGSCRGYPHCRENVLCRPTRAESTRPNPVAGTMIELDPFSYNDLEIAADLLELTGIKIRG